MNKIAAHPVDEMLPPGKLLILGLQHVLVMYAGAVAVPLIIGGAAGVPKDQVAFLISADLFCCGIATLLQSIGIGMFGIRMPVIMVVTFAAVGPMLAMVTNFGPGPNRGIRGDHCRGRDRYLGGAHRRQVIALLSAYRYRYCDYLDRVVDRRSRHQLGRRRSG